MKEQQPSDPTLAYYAKNARPFAEGTVGMDMSSLYGEFLPLLPKGGRILDAGCGSGRDALYFMRRGFEVTAFDASLEMAAAARKLLDRPVPVMAFLDVDWEAMFDGIWACASLLHVPRSQIDEVLRRLARALRPSGVLYASFKYGNTEEVRDGRFFNDYNETSLRSVAGRRYRFRSARG